MSKDKVLQFMIEHNQEGVVNKSLQEIANEIGTNKVQVKRWIDKLVNEGKVITDTSVGKRSRFMLVSHNQEIFGVTLNETVTQQQSVTVNESVTQSISETNVTVCPFKSFNDMLKEQFPNGIPDDLFDDETKEEDVTVTPSVTSVTSVTLTYSDEDLESTKKWMSKMNITGSTNDYVHLYSRWKQYRDNLQVVGTLENMIYRFHDGKPNYSKLIDEMDCLEKWNQYTTKMDMIKILKERKAKGITTLIPPTQEEIKQQWTDFGFENRNPYISDGEYHKLFDYWCKEVNKQFKSQKERINMLYKMMEITQSDQYEVLESKIDFKISEYKRLNKKQ